MEDFTHVLESAAKEMKEGEFMLSAGFTLFDSISALETMEPKMDSGLIVPEFKESILKFRRWKENPTFPDFQSDLDSVIAIIDALFACETMWLNGFSWLQSHLTCYYVLSVESFESEQVKAMEQSNLSITIIKAVVYSMLLAGRHLRNISMRFNVLAEEDFQTYEFGVALPPFVAATDVFNLLVRLEESLVLLASEKSSQPKLLNLIARIRFRKSFLLFLSCMDREEASRKLEDLKIQTLSCISQLRVLEPAKLSSNTPLSDLAFDPNISKKKSVNFPPRRTEYHSFDVMVAKYLSIFNAILDVIGLDKNFFVILEFYMSLPNRKLSFLARSILSNVSLFVQCPLSRFIRDSVNSQCDSDLTIDKAFVETAVETVSLIFHMKCLNAGRSHRNIKKSVETVYDLYMYEKNHLNDGSEKSLALLKWSKTLLFEFLCDYMHQGILLDLYSPFEYPFVFWYFEWFLGDLGGTVGDTEINRARHLLSQFFLVTFIVLRQNESIRKPIGDNRETEEARFWHRFEPLNCILNVSYESVIQSFEKFLAKIQNNWKQKALGFLNEAEILCKSASVPCMDSLSLDDDATEFPTTLRVQTLRTYHSICMKNALWLEHYNASDNVELKFEDGICFPVIFNKM